MLLDFSGVVNDKYRKNEVKRLSVYVSRVMLRSLVWRITHPYLLVDRVENVSRVLVHGYVRVTLLKKDMSMHLSSSASAHIGHGHGHVQEESFRASDLITALDLQLTMRATVNDMT